MRPEIEKYGSSVVIKPNRFIYDEVKQINVIDGRSVISSIFVNDATTRTDSTESADPDEIIGMSTTMTETTEPSDPDEIYAGSTTATATAEDADPDEICIAAIFTPEGVGHYSSQATKTVETADPDEIIPGM